MRTIIGGSKTIQDYALVEATILASGFADQITSVLCTMEPGPPIFGYRWGVTNKKPVTPYIADWRKWGKPAGIIRDREMATFCDAAVLLWDGHEWMTPKLKDYFRQLDPGVRCHFIKHIPANMPASLVNQGREESLSHYEST